MSTTVGPNRWLGSLPKIGIRPTIDGRRQGVRESLEEQTMSMARVVAGLLTTNLRHPNGSPVECVIADTTIGGVAEAAACAEKFARAGVGIFRRFRFCFQEQAPAFTVYQVRLLLQRKVALLMRIYCQR